MSSGLSGLKDLPYFLIGSALLLGTMLLLNKGCAHLAGTDIRQDNQVKQIEALGFPENTKLIKKWRSTPGYSQVGASYSYETSLSQNTIVSFYTKRIIQSNWGESEVTKELDSNGEEITFYVWRKKKEHLTLSFMPRNSNKLMYSIRIHWNQYN